MGGHERAFEQIKLRRMAGHLGAEARGIDLSSPLSPPCLAELRAALHTYKVIVVRGQDLTHTQQIALGRQFGELTRRAGRKHGAHPDGFPEILTVDPDVEDTRYGRSFEEYFRRKWVRVDSAWHSDLTAAVNPPAICILRAEFVPEFGGDTQWTNLVAAYRGLSTPVQQFVDGLHAEHALFVGIEMLDPEDADMVTAQNEDPLVSVHPVVRVHPETGEKALFVQPASARRIVGLTPIEGRRVLEMLFDQITRPEFTMRFRWEAGDVVMWDNRSTAHLPATDLAPTDSRRSLYRVTVLGDRPVGPDGFVSTPVRGDPLSAFVG